MNTSDLNLSSYKGMFTGLHAEVNTGEKSVLLKNSHTFLARTTNCNTFSPGITHLLSSFTQSPTKLFTLKVVQPMVPPHL
jgi:hypothetical protein